VSMCRRRARRYHLTKLHCNTKCDRTLFFDTQWELGLHPSSCLGKDGHRRPVITSQIRTPIWTQAALTPFQLSPL
jgi:hypothetical protein